MIINGGRRPQENYQSHLLHVRQVARLLADDGVPPDHIAMFMSDGSDPTADVAVRETAPAIDDLWRVAGSQVEAALRPPTTFVDSRVDGIRAQPATREALTGWFAQTLPHAGDTLMIYVTDHGSKNAKDVTNNSISLWGDGQDLSVEELRALVQRLAPGVRVVTVMSQCFSGSFAYLDPEARAPANICGFFASTPERPAYGCYPENRGRDNVGHSFHFLASLARTGSLVESHNQTLVADDTPDVPLRTSDVFLRSLLEQNAAAHGRSINAVVDELLANVWSDAAAWEPEIRLLDRVAHRFGYSSPRSLAQLETQTKDLPDITGQISRVAQAWKGALQDNNRAIVGRFLNRHPDWRRRLSIPPNDLATTRQHANNLIPDLARFTATQSPATESRLQFLHTKGAATEATRYRMEVRLAALLRLKTLLTRIAGLQYIKTQATTDEQTRYRRLASCENFQIAPSRDAVVTLQSSPDFPPFEDDVSAAQAGLPSYIGIQFRDLDEERRKLQHLNDGAAAVLAVYPNTPAARAAIEVGDIITGANGKPFTQANEVRTWSMLAAAGTPASLEVIHEGKARRAALTPDPYPLRWPDLPGPPKVGALSPLLRSTAYRGSLPTHLADGSPHVLFFWATWCAICKAALPELLAFEKGHGAQVIAITDEPATLLNNYFSSVTSPFPQTVAIDEMRRDFSAYGVSGSPTFVLIDGQGRIQAYTTGYSKERGLAFPNWKWSAP